MQHEIEMGAQPIELAQLTDELHAAGLAVAVAARLERRRIDGQVVAADPYVVLELADDATPAELAQAAAIVAAHVPATPQPAASDLALEQVLGTLGPGWGALTTDARLEALRQAINWHVTFNVDTSGVSQAGGAE